MSPRGEIAFPVRPLNSGACALSIHLFAAVPHHRKFKAPWLLWSQYPARGSNRPAGEIAAMKAHVIAFASALMGTMPAALAAAFMNDPPWNA